MTHQTRVILALVLAAGLDLASSRSAAAQPPDTIILNGRIATVDAASSVQDALAIRDGRIIAVGTGPDIRRLADATTRVIDLEGRTVIPGLIDSHMHAIRAGLSFATEVNWVGAGTLTEALGRISDAAKTMAPGAWLIVAGGWNVEQFAENRRPTQADLVRAAPDNPVYVQLGYGWAVMTPAAFEALGIGSEDALPDGGRFERDAAGRPTGAVTGGIVALFDRLPKPTVAQQVAGTKAFFRELNRLGMTGVVDPGGNNLTPADYQALFAVWRQGAMTVRVAYSLSGWDAGNELAEFQNLTTLLPMGFGDSMLHFNGLGERVTGAMNNNNSPSEADRAQFYEVARWAAGQGLTMTVHWGSDASVEYLLTIFERVNRDIPIAPLRWSIAHLNDASVANLERMRALGVGWTMQDAMYFGGDALLDRVGPEAASRIPPIETARQLGVVVGAGTDAHRVASYNPFTALQWLLDGRTVSGVVTRGPDERPSRMDALRFYTAGSAWFSHDEDERGSLEVGKLADLAVLSKDYLTVPVEEVGGIESILTMVGGRVVYAAGPYAPLDDVAAAR